VTYEVVVRTGNWVVSLTSTTRYNYGKTKFRNFVAFPSSGGGRKTLLCWVPRLALSKGHKRIMSSSPHLRTETDPISETCCFLVFKNSGRWTHSRTLVILSVIHHR
jgi:hypothetical protein